MNISVIKWREGWRWVVACALVVSLTMLAEICLQEGHQTASLGIEAQWHDQKLIVDSVVFGSHSWTADIRAGQEIVALDGQPVVLLDHTPNLTSVRSLETNSSDGRSYYVSTPNSSAMYEQRSCFIIVAAAWVAVSVLVFVLATDLLAAGALLALAFCGSTLLIASIASLSGSSWPLVVTGSSFLAAGPTMLFFCLVFPFCRLADRYMRMVAITVIAHAVVFSLLQFWMLFPNNIWYEAVGTFLHYFGRIEFVLCVAGSIFLMISAPKTRSIPSREARNIIGILALGFLAGFAPFCMLTLIPELFGSINSRQYQITIVASLIIPLTLGVAVLSKQFFGIRFLMQRSLIALMVWLTLLFVYTAIAESLIISFIDSKILIIAIVAGTFGLTQHFIRRWLERWLIAVPYDYAPTLSRLASDLVGLNDLDAIAQHVLDKVVSTLDLAWGYIIVTPGEDAQPLWYRSGPCPELEQEQATGQANQEPNQDATPIIASVTALIAEGRSIGVLGIGPKKHELTLTDEDQALLETVAPFAATALRNALLKQQLEQKVEQLSDREATLAALSAKLMVAQEEERRQIALELHDDPLQRVILLARQTKDGSRERQYIEEIIASLRALCNDLHPPTLDDFGLALALERLVTTIRARSDIVISLMIHTTTNSPFGRLDLDLETALYRVAQEALFNTLKHADASRVDIELERDGEIVTLSVTDDGCGYHPGPPTTSAPQLGIIGMRERLRPWGGTLTVYAPEYGGTVVCARVTAALPIQSGEAMAC